MPSFSKGAPEHSELVGPLHIRDVDCINGWLSPNEFAVDLSMIHLDGLFTPVSRKYRDYRDTDDPVKNQICQFIRSQVSPSTKVWFKLTMSPSVFAGIGQRAGIIYFDSTQESSLQEKLISQGLARVDRHRARSQITRKIIEKWLQVEEEARVQKRGYWGSDPVIMKRAWDDVPNSTNSK